MRLPSAYMHRSFPPPVAQLESCGWDKVPPSPSGRDLCRAANGLEAFHDHPEFSELFASAVERVE